MATTRGQEQGVLNFSPKVVTGSWDGPDASGFYNSGPSLSRGPKRSMTMQNKNKVSRSPKKRATRAKAGKRKLAPSVGLNAVRPLAAIGRQTHAGCLTF